MYKVTSSANVRLGKRYEVRSTRYELKGKDGRKLKVYSYLIIGVLKFYLWLGPGSYRGLGVEHTYVLGLQTKFFHLS